MSKYRCPCCGVPLTPEEEQRVDAAIESLTEEDLAMFDSMVRAEDWDGLQALVDTVKDRVS
jgi:hypothetical protein